MCKCWSSLSGLLFFCFDNWVYLAIFEIVKSLLVILLMFASVFAPMFLNDGSKESVFEGRWSRVRTVRIVAAGDLMQHLPQVMAARLKDDTTKYDYTPSFRYVASHFRDADLSIVNLETTLSESGPYYGYPCFKSPAEVADAMQDMGIDVAALANNHCCDRGAYGIKSTAEILDKRGISRVGVYRDSVEYKANNVLYLKQSGISFAIVNYTYGTNGINVPKGMVVNHLDSVAMARDLASINRDSVDCVIAVVHWGNEYERQPNREQKKMADFMRRSGVDIILGSHPHVVQPFEVDDRGVTLYSLGNFVSNQRTRYRDGGLIATIDVTIVERGEGDEVKSRSVKYDLDVTPVWVHLPDYAVIPPEVGDAMQMNYDSRIRYNRFMKDTHEHLGI